MKPFVFLILLCRLLCLLGCRKYTKDCFLYHYPNVVLTNLDTTESDSIIVEEYKFQYGFDSLVRTKYFSFDTLSNGNADSVHLPVLYFNQYLSYVYPQFYNFKITFGNNRKIFLSNFKYNNNKCEYDQPGNSFTSCSCFLAFYSTHFENCNGTFAQINRLYISQ